MTTNQDFYSDDEFRQQIPLPNATIVLVLGIISIIGCCCYGILGLTCGIIALLMANSAIKLYKENPNFYTESSYKNINTGKICAIIGIIFSGLTVLAYIMIILKFGLEVFSNPYIIYDYYNIPRPF